MHLTGIFSGLTLGLLSLDSTQLQVLSEAGKPNEQRYAKRIRPLVKRHHLLLVTLLVSTRLPSATSFILVSKQNRCHALSSWPRLLVLMTTASLLVIPWSQPTIHSFTHSLIHSLLHSLTHTNTHSLLHSLTPSLLHSLTRSLTHSLTHSPNHDSLPMLG